MKFHISNFNKIVALTFVIFFAKPILAGEMFSNYRSLIQCMNGLGMFGPSRNISADPWIASYPRDKEIYMFSDRTLHRLDTSSLTSKSFNQVRQKCGIEMEDGSLIVRLQAPVLAGTSFHPTSIYLKVNSPPENPDAAGSFSSFQHQGQYGINLEKLNFPGSCDVSSPQVWGADSSLQTQVQVDILNELLKYPSTARSLEQTGDDFLRRNPDANQELIDGLGTQLSGAIASPLNHCKSTGNSAIAAQVDKVVNQISAQGRAGAYRDGSGKIQKNPQHGIHEAVK